MGETFKVRGALLPGGSRTGYSGVVPGAAHEILLTTLRDTPSLLAALVHAIAKKRLRGALHPVDSNIRALKPAEVRPDMVFRRGKHHWMLFELQHRVDATKRRRWLLAAAALLNQHGTMGELVVLTKSPRVAAWAARVAHARGALGTRFELTPIVLLVTDENVDRLLDPARPELALFAAWAVHNRRGPRARRIAERALDVTDRLPRRLQEPQARAILNVLGDRLFAALKQMALDPDKIPMSRAAQRLWRLFEKRAEELRRAREVCEGIQESLFAVLKARGLRITAREHAKVYDCLDQEQLRRWLVAAATASSTAEVFQAKPRRRVLRARSATAPRIARKRAAGRAA